MFRSGKWVSALAAVLLLAGLAWAEPVQLQKMNLVEKMQVPAGAACAIDLAIKDRAGFADATIGIKGKEVSLVLPRTYTHPPVLQFNKLDSKCFEKAVVAQIDNQTVRAVLFLKEGYNGDTTPSFAIGENLIHIALGAKPLPAAEPIVLPTMATPEPAAENVPPEAKIDWAAILAAPPTATPTPAAEPAATPAPEKPAPAAAAAAATATPAPDEIGWSKAVIKMIAALAGGLAAILILAGLAKRFKLPARLTGGRSGLIRVVQTGMLDMKRRVAVVDVAGELLVVALANNQVTMLAKIENETARRRLLGDEAAPRDNATADLTEPAFFEAGPEIVKTMGTAANDFSAKLRAYTRHAPQESAVAGHDTLNSIVEKVKKLKRL
ncbi:MAG: flagellar biosynthetic protein FliO [Myxococcales bacterium]|nr:flagellar biosynthetic protein FliO [Myxococcales bacterium]